MDNFADVTGENITKHNPNRPQIPNHPCSILKIGALNQKKRKHVLI